MNAAAPMLAVAATARPASNSAHAGLLLQRKCACGSPTSPLTGSCPKCGGERRLQAKLSIGASTDPLEQEADRVAEQVSAASTYSAINGAPPHIQRYTGQATGQDAAAPASVDRVLAGAGTPLEPALRQDMEQRFGHDFSRVRVHSGTAAEQSARDVNADAYTVGHHIVFGAGRFAPGTHEGRRLTAHELTHVVQQAGSEEVRVDQRKAKAGLSPLSQPGNAGEVLQRNGSGPSTSPAPELPRKIIPGSTPLSREVQAYRIGHPNLPEGINLVGVEYSIPGVNELQRRVFENIPGVAHSEQVMDQFFLDLRRSARKEIEVLKVYSERQPCGPSAQDCEGLLLKSERFRSAEKTFGYDYQEGAPRVPGQGPYRAGETRGRIEDSHERLNETKNLEWDFQKKPTQPYHERKGPPPRGDPSVSGKGPAPKPPGATVKPDGANSPSMKAQTGMLLEGLGEDLRLLRTARVLSSIVRTVEFAGALVMIYQSFSMATNEQAGEGFVLTEKIKEAENLQARANGLKAEYPAYSDRIQSLGPSIYAAGFDPASIKPLLGEMSDLGADIVSQKIDLRKQSERVKVALKEVTNKRQAARKILDDPVALAALDHGGGTINAATVFAAESDLSRIESALMQVDGAFDTLISEMDSDVEFLVTWLSWLEDIGIGAGKLPPIPNITISMHGLEELGREPEDLDPIE